MNEKEDNLNPESNLFDESEEINSEVVEEVPEEKNEDDHEDIFVDEKDKLTEAQSDVQEAFGNEDKESSRVDNELDEVIENILKASNKGELLMNDLIDVVSQLDPEIRNVIAEGIKEISSEDINNDIKELQEKLDKLDAIVRGGGTLNEKEGKEKKELEAEIAMWLIKLAIKVFVEIIKSLPKPSSGRTNV